MVRSAGSTTIEEVRHETSTFSPGIGHNPYGADSGRVVMVFPLLWMLVTSIKTITEATIIPPTLWPDVPQWQNWMDVLIGDGVLQTFFHTLLNFALLHWPFSC